MKKGIGYEFLVRLLIAVIAIVAVVSIGASLFRITDAAEKSFNEFVKKIEGAKDWNSGTSDSIRLDMDEDTRIIGFVKMADELKLTERPIKLSRPEACPKQESCVCLCKEFDCEEPLCQSFSDINFPFKIKLDKMTDYLSPSLDNPSDILENGFIFARHDRTQRVFINYGINQPPRSRSIRIEKGPGQMVSVCLSSKAPCVEWN